MREFLKDNTQGCKEYFIEFCSRNETTFTIKSYDKDISYSIGDEVIIIDWNSPEEMFNIRTIVGFMTDDFCFYLKLTDDNSNVLNYPVVKFMNDDNPKFGTKNYFATVRKVCRKIENLEVGMKVRAKLRSISDFPMKDCNQIKAFIIDDIVPLVLFSNYRTLLVNGVNKMFDIFNHEQPMFHKLKISEPSKKIKNQYGDIFMVTSSKINQLFGIVNSNYYYHLTPTSYNGFITRRIDDDYDYKTIRYGLMSPRYSPTQLSLMHSIHGNNMNEYGNILKAKTSSDRSNANINIRTDWSVIS